MENPDVLNVQQSLGIVGRSPLLLHALHAAIQAAPFDVSVLVTGENGTGKEAFHRILHNYSLRRHKKCVAVNCGGLPEGTIDSELFGHVKGAYTGAVNDRKGYFEEADGGTIFLDEIGELPMATQARLLRVLETGEYYRMGSSEVRKTDVRIVAATNVDLQEAIRRGRFREDLYYRLSTITINVPPLRERQEDIRLLFLKFAGDVAAKYRMPVIRLDEAALHLLLAYQWPGNVRQLLHVVEEVSIVEQERLITAPMLQRYLPAFTSGISLGGDTHTDGGQGFGVGEKEMLYKVIFDMKQQLDEVRRHLGMGNSEVRTPTHALTAGPVPTPTPTAPTHEMVTEDLGEAIEVPSGKPTEILTGKPVTLEQVEREAIRQALERNGGNKHRAAEELGISERTIHRKIQDYGL